MIKTKTQTVEVGTIYTCDVLKKEIMKEDVAYTFYNQYCISLEAVSLLPVAIKTDKDLVRLITHWFYHHHIPAFSIADLNKGWWILTRNQAHNEFNNIINVKGEYPNKHKPPQSPLMSLDDCVKEIATFEHGWESWIFHDGLLVKYFKNYAQPDVSKDLTHTRTFDGVRTDDDLLPISYLSRVENTKDGSISYYLSTFKENWGPFKFGQEVGVINLDFRTGRLLAVEKVHLSNGQLEADTFKLEGRLCIQFVDVPPLALGSYKVTMTHTVDGAVKATKSLTLQVSEENKTMQSLVDQALDLASSSQVGLFRTMGEGNHNIKVISVVADDNPSVELFKG